MERPLRQLLARPILSVDRTGRGLDGVGIVWLLSSIHLDDRPLSVHEFLGAFVKHRMGPLSLMAPVELS